jgi:hypothetical protein
MVKNRSTLVSALGFVLAVICLFLFSIAFGMLFGIIVGISVVVIFSLLRTKFTKPKDFSKVSLESILKIKHEEISYSQIEKVEMEKGAYQILLYGRCKEKAESIRSRNGKRHKHNVSLIREVLHDRVIIK